MSKAALVLPHVHGACAYAAKALTEADIVDWPHIPARYRVLIKAALASHLPQPSGSILAINFDMRMLETARLPSL